MTPSTLVDARPQFQVRVFDKDLVTSDDDLGYTIVPLAGIDDGSDLDLDLELKGDQCR